MIDMPFAFCIEILRLLQKLPRTFKYMTDIITKNSWNVLNKNHETLI